MQIYFFGLTYFFMMVYIVSAAGNFFLTEDESAGCLNVGLSDSGIFRMEMEKWKLSGWKLLLQKPSEISPRLNRWQDVKFAPCCLTYPYRHFAKFNRFLKILLLFLGFLSFFLAFSKFSLSVLSVVSD